MVRQCALLCAFDSTRNELVFILSAELFDVTVAMMANIVRHEARCAVLAVAHYRKLRRTSNLVRFKAKCLLSSVKVIFNKLIGCYC